MKPPKVSRAQLNKQRSTVGECSCGATHHNHGPNCPFFARTDIGEQVPRKRPGGLAVGVSRPQSLKKAAKGTAGGAPRQPLGLLPNALPSLYLVRAFPSGSLLVMCDKSKNPDGVTGPQVCLATISPETLAMLLASKSPVELKP